MVLIKGLTRYSFVWALLFLCPVLLPAQDPGGLLGKALAQPDVDANADSLGFVGSNIVAKGHVVVRYKDIRVIADKAVINISTKDIEAIGNVELIRRSKSLSTVDLWELEDLRNDPHKRVEIEGYISKATGRQMVQVSVYEDESVMKGSRAVGNLASGMLEFADFACKTGEYVVKGKRAVRTPDGKFVVRDVQLSTCEYMMDNHEHYSITAGKAVITPRDTETSKNLTAYNADQGEHSIWAYWCTFRIGDVPLLWLPVLYKPSDPDSLGIQVRVGHTSEWGYFVKLSKKFRILSDPDTTSKMMVDYYSSRGLALGNETEIHTEKSYTDLYAYGLHDRSPYGTDNDTSEDGSIDEPEWKKANERLRIPKDRYELRLSHINHITPRMDFRGQIDKLSDINFLKDFFEDRYNDDPQPITFSALEYQFDRFSTSLEVRPRVNKFFSEVERLPEFRIDVPRQELFKNIYYQGETSLSYLRMKWRDYDSARTTGNLVDPKDYKAGRFDTLHMFYYPFSIGWLNLIPRAGARLTYYSKTSKTSVNQDSLNTMLIVDAPDGNPDGDVINYDRDGSGKLRLAGEFGFEANTKISRAWQSAKNAFWEIDGMRHVMVPYINYTYIPDPTVSRDHIYYFDDIDRLNEQNFVRFGLKNRLETRRGDYGREKIYNWASLENYFDFHFQREKGFKNLGELGTLFSFTPFSDLSFTSNLLLDIGQSSEHNTEAYRADHYAGRPGLSWKMINKWENTLSYQIMKDWRVYASYSYQDAYKERSIYSMGSSLASMNSGTSFSNSYGRGQTATIGSEFPIPIDKKTFAAFEMAYDFEAGYVTDKKFKLIRKLHCWEASLELRQETKRDQLQSKEYNNSIAFMIYLTAMPSARIPLRGGTSTGGSGDSSDSSSN